MKLFVFALLPISLLLADGPGVIQSVHSAKEFALTADPASPAWKNITPVLAENGPMGTPVPGHRTEIRSRWTDKNLYFLFVCPYEDLNLKPEPSTTTETNKLWDYDVAEVFVGADFEKIWRYREFQVSPQGEWVDLDIDRKTPLPGGGASWNSGYKVKAHLDKARKVWYGEMQIPIASVTDKPVKADDEMRINFYRIQAAKPRKFIAWQPTGNPSYHTPESFGRIRLVKEAK
jgi:hypothetical protein